MSRNGPASSLSVALLSQSRVPSESANSINVLHMAAELSKVANTVSLVAHFSAIDDSQVKAEILNRYGLETCFKIIRRRSARNAVSRLVDVFRIVLRLRRQATDLVICRDLLGAVISAALGLKVIFESHHPISVRGFAQKAQFWTLIRLQQFQGLVVITQALKRHFERNWQTLRGKVEVAPDGAISRSELEPDTRLVSGHSGPNIAYVGHAYRGKGVELVVEIAALMPRIQFHVVGADRNQVADLVASGDLPLNLHCHGWVNHKDVPGIIRSFDVLLLPNQREVFVSGGSLDIGKWTSPLKMFEYMDSGRPVICSKISPLMEVARPGKNMLVCDPEKPEDWVQSIDWLLANKNLGRQLAESARTDLISHYTWRTRAQKFLEFSLRKT